MNKTEQKLLPYGPVICLFIFTIGLIISLRFSFFWIFLDLYVILTTIMGLEMKFEIQKQVIKEE